MAILSFDPAYSLTGSKPALVHFTPHNGSFEVIWESFRPKQKDLDSRFNEILAWINTFAHKCDPYTITKVSAYKTSFGSASRNLSELVGMYRGWAWGLGYENFSRYADNTVKAALCGSGKADKAQMFKFVKTIWPEAPEKEPDVIDAFGLAYFTHNRSR